MPLNHSNALGVGLAANVNHMRVTVAIEMGKFSHGSFFLKLETPANGAQD